MIPPPPTSTLFPYTTLFRSFIEHCEHEHVPVDFVSTHVYGDDTAQDIFGTHERIPRERMVRSEEHTSELQSQSNLVCRLLLEKKKKKQKEFVENLNTDILF